MFGKGASENRSEGDWLEEDPPERDSFLFRVIAAMVIVAIFLILMGIPTDNPLVFLSAVAFITGGAMFFAILNAELSKGLFGKKRD